MTIKNNLFEAQQYLEKISPTPDVDVIYLMMHVLQKDSTWIFMHSEDQLTPTQHQLFWKLIKERAQGQPIAYLTGIRGFWTLDLKVNEHVLIPRPETELIIEIALEYLPKEKDCKIADLGTGSGAIALSLATERSHWHIDAADISLEALNIAKLNAKNHSLNNVNFYQGSWCQALPSHDYDAIISNPPYLSNDDQHAKEGDLRFEPKQALISGTSGLEAYEQIIKQSKDYLKPNGFLLFEHGFAQRDDIVSLLKQNHYQNIECFNDYQNLPRAILAYQ